MATFVGTCYRTSPETTCTFCLRAGPDERLQGQDRRQALLTYPPSPSCVTCWRACLPACLLAVTPAAISPSGKMCSDTSSLAILHARLFCLPISISSNGIQRLRFDTAFSAINLAACWAGERADTVALVRAGLTNAVHGYRHGWRTPCWRIHLRKPPGDGGGGNFELVNAPAGTFLLPSLFPTATVPHTDATDCGYHLVQTISGAFIRLLLSHSLS